jgi:hypothetical protein
VISDVKADKAVLMLSLQLKNPDQQTAGKKEKKKKNNMCLLYYFSAPMHRFDKNHVTNFKKKSWQSIFHPLQSDINWVHPVSLGKPISCIRNCTAHCYLNIREGPATWYAGLLHQAL